MAKERPVTLVGLDIGTAKTAVLIAEANSAAPRVIGAGVSPSVGLEKGIIIAPDAVAKSIGQALEQAERTAGVKGAYTFASFNGASSTVVDCSLINGSNNHTICRENPVELKPTGATDKKIITMLQPHFIPDVPGYFSDCGAKAVAVAETDIINISDSAARAGLMLQDVLYTPIAGAGALIHPTEKELGTLLVDLGAGTTTISILSRGSLRETAVLPLGGEHLLGDLAIGLHTSLARAGEIINHYSPLSESEETEETQRIKSIIEVRILEILDIIASVVKGFHYPGLLPGGAVFYGGVAGLRGISSMAESKLEMPVRIGSTGTAGLELCYANALGLVRYGNKTLFDEKGDFVNRQNQQNVMNKFINWFQGRLR